MARLVCQICGEPIKRGAARGNRSYDEGFNVLAGVERAWHADCLRDRMVGEVTVGEILSPFQSLLLAAKQVIAQSRNLSPVEHQAFIQIVGQALNVQRRS